MLSDKSNLKSVIKKAKKWAEKTWDDALPQWEKRSEQDYQYRKFVVEPSISKISAKLDLNPQTLVVEFGCGDGVHSIFWRRLLNKSNLESVQIFGLDLFQPFIAKAQKNALAYKNISFKVADVSDMNSVKIIHDKVGIPDVIVGMFLLQDIPDLEGVLKTVMLCLKEGGHFISVFVHPDFGEHLLEAGHIKIKKGNYLPARFVSDNGIVQWQFLGFYPIIQPEKQPFYLPYFHRSLNDYYDAFRFFNLSVKEKIPLSPSKIVLKKLKGEKRSPFIQNEWNVYWPWIISEPSSMLIHVVKEAKE